MTLFKDAYNMLLNGSHELSIGGKRDYYANIPDSPRLSHRRVWQALGERLRSSAEKTTNNTKLHKRTE